MPVFLPAFPEERRHGRRRGNLKGRSTDRARAHFLRRITLGLFKWHWPDRFPHRRRTASRHQYGTGTVRPLEPL
jgi:hypothetical protein